MIGNTEITLKHLLTHKGGENSQLMFSERIALVHPSIARVFWSMSMWVYFFLYVCHCFGGTSSSRTLRSVFTCPSGNRRVVYSSMVR